MLTDSPIVIIEDACRVCGWSGWTAEGLCTACRDLHEWSRINRAFCDLVHRGRASEPG